MLFEIRDLPLYFLSSSFFPITHSLPPATILYLRRREGGGPSPGELKKCGGGGIGRAKGGGGICHGRGREGEGAEKRPIFHLLRDEGEGVPLMLCVCGRLSFFSSLTSARSKRW